jgi:RES domain-containing protein
MPDLWRLYRAPRGPGLDGIGGTFADGRWHTRGKRVVYFGASAAIAVLECLAHTDPDLLPNDLQLAHFAFSADVPVTRIEDQAALPADWTRDEDATRRIGDHWWDKRASCLLIVPSAILPEESNLVLNPQHPDAQFLQLIRERPFAFDTRLIE